MRKVTVTVELPQSAELAAELVKMILSEHNEDVKAMLEAILDQLRRDYAQNGI
jgi:RecJ-like exonuclease